ncbi:Dienelactone hydrolase [Micromonospora pattaloongensis]|uniref:Dienelactone hydrolase n=1 Tax=Micromonospora pattaloongensis TaxID=405436 RepID=A0A1H3P1Q6_9ACTN|nr:alpha/beta fold hydrolase [Micromonospora pattaloongensis]SDY94981.1 Dienelactone hydrolase [Micromonospora pattaloongensis]
MQTQTAATVIPTGDAQLNADIVIPPNAAGVVVFAHGSGSSRHSPRNRSVAQVLNRHGIATVLADLLTVDEERVDEQTGHLRFDIQLLAERVFGIVDWLRAEHPTGAQPLGLFGASTGGGAALVAAAARPDAVRAVVSRGGRPDLAGASLGAVRAPTLLLVGGLDEQVLQLNEQARAAMPAGIAEVRVVPGATHLFEEPGTLEQVAEHAARWFEDHLRAGVGGR